MFENRNPKNSIHVISTPHHVHIPCQNRTRKFLEDIYSLKKNLVEEFFQKKNYYCLYILGLDLWRCSVWTGPGILYLCGHITRDLTQRWDVDRKRRTD
jgi:hypothetical protein